MPRAELEAFRARDPVIGVVRGEEHLVAEAVFHFLPRGPFLKAQPEGHAVGRHTEQEAEEPARDGSEGNGAAGGGGGMGQGVFRGKAVRML